MKELVKVENLKKHFPLKRSLVEVITRTLPRLVKAVDGVSFSIKNAETLGLVGESGSGKTTIGRLILRLLDPTDGKILFDDREITSLKSEDLRRMRKDMQIIFQDPMAALNPYMKIGEAVRHPLKIHKIGSSKKEQLDIVYNMFEKVNLTPPKDFYHRYPKELSGGQRQRVVIARALITNPRFVVADEALAMLDVSVRSQLLQLLLDLKNEFNLTYLFITHDLATTKYICDRIIVMYLGKILEIGSFDDIYRSPAHPYTKALISAVPEPDPKIQKSKKKLIPQGEVPNPINPPSGCRFHPRCPYVIKNLCSVEEPVMKEISSNHFVACHLFY